ncbi:MAG: hypothetical protein L3J33_02425 [Rhodobacteraceae bacterium]|nr:hypothetical protein [Paracoccaceae bacterium]
MKLSTLFTATTSALLLSVSLAAAQVPAQYADNTYVNEIATQLTGQGFQITRIHTTLLGRIVIEATDGNTDREIVLAPSTGRIIRDESETADGLGQDGDLVDDGDNDIEDGFDDDGNDDNDNDDDDNDGENDDDENDGHDGGNDDGGNDDDENDND